MRRFWRRWRRELVMPERWDELDGRQFLAAVRLWSGTIPMGVFLCEVYGFKMWEVRRMDDYQRWVLLHGTDWMQDLRRPHNAFFLQRLPGSDLYSPGPRLKGCSLQQFMTFDTYYSQYVIAAKDGDKRAPQFLDLFLGALYKGEEEVFTVSEGRQLNIPPERVRLVVMDEHLKVVEKVDDLTKQAIVMNYVLIRSWLCKAFPQVFPEGDDDGVSNKAKHARPVDWLGVFDNFVGEHVAEMEKYQAMGATDAFRVMNRRIREAKKRAVSK